MNETSPAFRLSEGNSVFLDLVRGMSAQAVVFGHALFFFGVTDLDTDPAIFVVQGYAVLLFFVLSGFLISYSTANKVRQRKEYGFTAFFIDRFARIYTTFIPSLLFVLAVDTLIIYLFPGRFPYTSGYNLVTFLGNLFMLQDVPGIPQLIGQRMTSFGSGRVFWTLAIEWWIYLFFGWTVLRVLRGKLGWYDLVVLLPLLVVPSFNLWGGKGNGLMMTWLFGALAYLIIADGYLNKIDRSRLLLLSGWLAAIGVIRFWKTGEEFDPILAFVSAAVIVLLVRYFTNTNWPTRLSSAIRTNAAYSYTLYLTHYSILEFLRIRFNGEVAPWALVVIGLVLSNVVAAALGLYVETRLTARVKTLLYTRFLR